MAGPYTYHGWTASTLTPAIPVISQRLPRPESMVSPTTPRTAGPVTLGAHTILNTVFGPNYQKILGLAPGVNAGGKPLKAGNGLPETTTGQNNTPTTTLTPQQLQANVGQPVSGWVAPSTVTNMGLTSLTPASQAAQKGIVGLGVPDSGTKLLAS